MALAISSRIDARVSDESLGSQAMVRVSGSLTVAASAMGAAAMPPIRQRARATALADTTCLRCIASAPAKLIDGTSRIDVLLNAACAKPFHSAYKRIILGLLTSSIANMSRDESAFSCLHSPSRWGSFVADLVRRALRTPNLVGGCRNSVLANARQSPLSI